MTQGIVKWFSGDRGYGFIAIEGPGRVRALQRDHRRRLPQPRGGQKVEFDITQGQKGPQAENVKVTG